MHAFVLTSPLPSPAVPPPAQRIAGHDFLPVRRPVFFRQFVAIPAMRTLLHRGTPIDIGGRAFDLLLALLRARGEIISKQEIMRQVWPSLFVDESNLRFQMAMLRRVLGADRDLIKTITGRGYLLVDERL